MWGREMWVVWQQWREQQAWPERVSSAALCKRPAGEPARGTAFHSLLSSIRTALRCFALDATSRVRVIALDADRSNCSQVQSRIVYTKYEIQKCHISYITIHIQWSIKIYDTWSIKNIRYIYENYTNIQYINLYVLVWYCIEFFQ